MSAVKAPHHPRAKRGQPTVVAVSPKEHKQKRIAYRDESGLSNIEKYNLKREKTAKKPRRRVSVDEVIGVPPGTLGSKPVTKTVREWADLVKERNDEQQKRYKAEDRTLSYQEENGKLNRELLKQRICSFFIGIGVGLSLAVCLLELWK